MINPYQWFRTQLRKIHDWWHTKNPKQKWDTIHDFGRIICDSIGIRIFSDMKNDWYTASATVCAIIYFVLNFYTIQYYLHRNDFVKIIECTYLIGFAVGVSLINFLSSKNGSMQNQAFAVV